MRAVHLLASKVPTGRDLGYDTDTAGTADTPKDGSLRLSR